MISLAKITIKVDNQKEVIHPVKEMILNKVKDIPDDYVVKFSDVKAAYPDIAEKLKSTLFKNKNVLTVKDIKILVKDMQATDDRFWLSEVPYQSGAQKQIGKDQIVIQFNFTPEMISEIRKSKPTYKFLSTLFNKKEGTMHPLNNKTFAWARVYKFNDAWVIEEMQSDFIGWDTGFKSWDKSQQAELDKFKDDEQKEIMDFLKKNFDKWEHKFLATIMQMARSKKVQNLYIFDESEKGDQQTSPSKLKWFYRTIPKNIGMSKDTLNVGSQQFQVWKKSLAQVKKEESMNSKLTNALLKVVAVPGLRGVHMITYEQAKEILGNKESKNLANNTKLVKTNKGFGIKLHSTVVVEMLPHGLFALNTGGWFTPTTKDRIAIYSPVQPYSDKGTWYIGRDKKTRVEFEDGMIVTEDGEVVG